MDKLLEWCINCHGDEMKHGFFTRIGPKEVLVPMIVLFSVGTVCIILNLPPTFEEVKDTEIIEKTPNILRFHKSSRYFPFMLQHEEKFEKFNLVGLKALPEFLDKGSHNTKPRYTHKLQPRRINGYNGILQLRDIQGNSWAGKLLKGGFVFFAQSAGPNLARRRLIRETWASIHEHKGWRIETVFVVGRTTNENEQRDLENESLQFGDLLQYDGNDRPSGANDKLLSTLQWASEVLPRDFFFASTMDYAMLNVPAVIHKVTSLASGYAPYERPERYLLQNGVSIVSSQDQTIHCLEWLHKNRTFVKEHFIRYQQFLEIYKVDLWPPYCSPGLYFMPVSLAGVLYDISRTTSDIVPPSMHSALVSGILRRKARRADNNIADKGRNKVTYVERFRSLAFGDNKNYASLEAEYEAYSTWREWTSYF